MQLLVDPGGQADRAHAVRIPRTLAKCQPVEHVCDGRRIVWNGARTFQLDRGKGSDGDSDEKSRKPCPFHGCQIGRNGTTPGCRWGICGYFVTVWSLMAGRYMSRTYSFTIRRALKRGSTVRMDSLTTCSQRWGMPSRSRS